MLKRRFFILFLLAFLSVTAISFDAYVSYKTINQEIMKESDFYNIKPSKTKSSFWSENFIEKDYSDDWKSSDINVSFQPFTFDECPMNLPPDYLYDTVSGSGKNLTIFINTYYAGTSVKDLTRIESSISSCWEIKKKVVKSTDVYFFDRGSFFTLGDFIFFIKTDNKTKRDEVTELVVSDARDSLISAGCADVDVKEEDFYRNFYIAKGEYTGLLKKDVVETRIVTDGIPTQIFDTLKNKPYMDEPEGPLPENFASLPERIEKPDVPVNKNQGKKFSKEIVFVVMDDEGPGCGWDWSDFQPPLINVDSVVSARKETYRSAQHEIDIEAQQYVDERIESVKQNIFVAEDIAEWNEYVSKVEKVHDKWSWLNTERNKIRNEWFTYVENYREWENFDSEQSAAQKEYDALVLECEKLDQQVEEWENEWGDMWREHQRNSSNEKSTSPTATPADSPSVAPSIEPTVAPSPEISNDSVIVIPNKPEGCVNQPVKPSILLKEKPSEPQPPVVPEGVTIPYSWRI